MAPHMPESEPKPRLIELVDPGVGQGWKAVLKNGKSVVVHEIPVPAAEAAGAVPRVQRLFEHRHPALSPVLAWGTDPNGLWVAVEPNEGVPLGTILSRGPLTPPAAAALGASLLSGVAALHEAGIAMGGFGAASVRVTGNGEVRLAGHPAGAVRGAPSQSDLRADVRSSGMAICAAFGVDPAGAPAPPSIPPGLVVTMRSMASGAMGPAADRAQGALREMAAALLSPDRLTASQAELATRAGGREMPPITPFLPQGEAPAPAPGPVSRAQTSYVPPPEDTPRPTAVSYDALPRLPDPKPAGPPGPSAWQTAAPAPLAAPEPPPPVSTIPLVPVPVPSPFATNAPPAAPPAPTPPSSPPAPAASAPSPYSTNLPPPSPFGTNAPAPPTWETAAPPTPTQAPPASPPLAAPPAYEPPAKPPSYQSTPPAPAPPAPAQQTWTPIATPAWTPNVAPDLAVAAETAAPVAPPSAPARRPSTTRPPDRESSSDRPVWVLPAIIVVVILLLLVGGGGIYLLTRPGSGGVVASHTPSPGKSPKPTAKATPTPTTGGLQAVPNYAPASATPVSSVAFCIANTHPCAGLTASDYTSCRLNGPCKVMVEIKFSTPQNGKVAYITNFFDRCTGTTTPLPGGNFTPSGFTRVDIQRVLSLPTGPKSAALVAVTTSPTPAASAPLLLGSDTC
jgi:hypothetical protein